MSLSVCGFCCTMELIIFIVVDVIDSCVNYLSIVKIDITIEVLV